MDKLLTYNIKKEMLLRDFLRKEFSDTIAIRIKKVLGNMKINGRPAIATDRVFPGDVLTIFLKENSKPYDISKDLSLRVLYNDDDLLIINKPKGVCSMSTNGHREDCVFAGLQFLFPGEVFRIVTRLDKDTEGLMLITKNALAHSILNESNISKKYKALLIGDVEKNVIIDAPIARADDIKRKVAPDGKPAKTVLKVLNRFGNQTEVELELLTGRTHQIRVHTAHIGHPIVGDTLYGGAQGEYNSGQNLKCTFLSFFHPFTKNKITIKL